MEPYTTAVLLPASLRAAAVARQMLREIEQRLPAQAFNDALLATSELVANAVLHGRPEFVLRIELRPGVLHVAVTDAAPEVPRLPAGSADPGQANGRGLLIVNEVATRWGVTSRPRGKDVWFDLDLDLDAGVG
jgi:anti-sigma regulatory factor (Ser/Thr protein kinase)